jgi:hypothetical protein
MAIGLPHKVGGIMRRRNARSKASLAVENARADLARRPAFADNPRPANVLAPAAENEK